MFDGTALPRSFLRYLLHILNVLPAAMTVVGFDALHPFNLDPASLEQ